MRLERKLRLALPLFAAALLLGSCTQPNVTPALALSDFARADVVIGQPDFTSIGAHLTATGVGYVSGDPVLANGVLYVPDNSQDRVLGFLGGIPGANGASADFVLGQPDFTTDSPNATAAGMSSPGSVASAGGKLFVADNGNSRVLGWNALPTSGTPADFVVGQTGFGSSSPDCTATALHNPTSVFARGNRLLIADSVNNRVLIYNTLPDSGGATPDLVLGQNSRTTCASNDDNQDGASDGAPTARTFDYPTDVWTDGTHLVVVDSFNNRVLVWRTFPTSDFQPADVALGQPDRTSNTAAAGADGMDQPQYVGGNGGALFVADTGNNRVLVFDTIPDASGAGASHVLGQSDFGHTAGNDDNQDGTPDTASARTLSLPAGVLATAGALLVSDSSNARVLVFVP